MLAMPTDLAPVVYFPVCIVLGSHEPNRNRSPLARFHAKVSSSLSFRVGPFCAATADDEVWGQVPAFHSLARF
jgi:hypothetical protein